MTDPHADDAAAEQALARIVPSPLGVAPGSNTPAEPADDGPDNPADGLDFSELPAEVADQFKAMQAALTKANKQAEKYRLAAKPKPSNMPAKKPAAPTEITDDVLDQVREGTRAEVENTYKPALIRATAESAFAAAGVSLPQDRDQRKAKIGALLRLVDNAELTIGDDGELEGLEDQIEELKLAMPEVFRPVRAKAPRIDGADKGAGTSKKLSPTDQVAALVFGQQ